MPKVTFLPMNTECDASEGESVLDVALNHDVPLQHACGGFCACTTCRVQVKSGGSSLSSVEDEEADLLNLHGIEGNDLRLGCQAKVHGDVTVEIVNLDV